MLSQPKPRWRGISHLVAAVVSVPAGVWLVATAPSGLARVAATVFALGIAAMFTASATYHRARRSPEVTEVLFRLDHTGIFLAIAGTATPVGLLGLDGWPRALLVGGVWIAALVGIVVTWLPFPPPRGFANTVFITLGWFPLPFLPLLWGSVGPLMVALLLIGGAFYTVGAILVALQVPDPAPEVFGYHEVWHLLVIAAVVTHYVMVSATLLPHGAP